MSKSEERMKTEKKETGVLPEGWKSKKLGTLGKVSSGTTPLRAKHSEYFQDGKIHWVKTTDLNNSLILSTEECVTERALKETSLRIYQPGTILVAMYGGFNQIGRTGLLGLEAAINQALSALQCESEIADSNYVLAWLNGNVESWRNFAGSSRKDPNITSKDVKDFPVNLPPLPEQRAIAAVLGTWDRGIDTLQCLIAAKQRHKKALMQQLLTGKKRFAEFGEPWQDVQYKDILKQVKRPVAWDDEEYYELISVRRRSGGLFHRESLYGHQILTKNLFTANKGDFLISKMQILHGASGLTTEEFDGMKVSGSYISVVARNAKQLDIEFLKWLSQLPYFYHQTFISSYGVHIEKMTFNSKIFLKLFTKIPSIEEQRKIVKFLNGLDVELNVFERKLAALQAQKKGLMQQLLTGKVRVKIGANV